MADETQNPASQDAAANAGAPERMPGEASPFAPNAEVLAAENGELKDRLLRTMAEMENLRRRTEKEVADARQYSVSAFAREMLTIGDNLRRAIDAVPEDQRKTAEGALSALLEGVELTERELVKILGKHGVKLIEPDGQRFDPNLHQAMFEVENASVPSGTVVNVVQPGYMIGARVLRPAMVGVSRGGPRPSRGAPAGEAVDYGAESGIDRSV